MNRDARGDDRDRGDEPRTLHPGLTPKADEPETPQDLDLRELPRAVRAELRGLSPQLSETVGAHLLMASQLIATDPALAYQHAEAARRRASRLPVTREAAGEAAYAAGEYAAALAEFRALRRMNGSNEYLPAMADCERALGNPDKALRLVAEALGVSHDFAQHVEIKLVEAGARYDLGQAEEALRVLRYELENNAGRGTRQARARLRYGYANLLEITGDTANAERWFAAAAAMDPEGETDAGDRLEALHGVVMDIDEDDLVGDEPPLPDGDRDRDDAPESAQDPVDAESEDEEAGDREGSDPASPQIREDSDVEEFGPVTDADIRAEVAELLDEDVETLEEDDR